jgi:hypothetical protein
MELLEDLGTRGITTKSGNYKKTRFALFLCGCGNVKELRVAAVKYSGVVSCGCSVGWKTNGASKHPLYQTWSNMKQRCYNPKIPRYKNYGARGITVCDRWRDSFKNFLEDMGERPSREQSIDRINNNKGYSKSNCKWSTRLEQAQNMQRSKKYNG